MAIGSDDDFTDYVRSRWIPLVRSARLLGCGPAEAEDLVQVALVRCYGSWSRVAAASSPDAYVYRTLVNCLAKSRRRRWWGEIPVDHVPEHGSWAPDHAVAASTALPLHDALARLVPEQRAVLVLRFYADLTEQQTAAALGIALGTVKSRTARALAALGRDDAIADLHHDRA